MIKAIIFDLFGVLTTEGFKRFCDKYFPHDLQKRRQAIDLVTAHDWGKITQDQYVVSLAELAGVEPETVMAHMGDNQPNDMLLGYIKKELKPKYKISVLSNSGGDYISEILSPSELELFDDVVLSYQHRLVKPQPEFYELAANRLGVEVAQCLLVDDSPGHCAGAKRAGMQAVLYENFPKIKQELEAVLSADADN